MLVSDNDAAELMIKRVHGSSPEGSYCLTCRWELEGDQENNQEQVRRTHRNKLLAGMSAVVALTNRYAPEARQAAASSEVQDNVGDEKSVHATDRDKTKRPASPLRGLRSPPPKLRRRSPPFADGGASLIDTKLTETSSDIGFPPPPPPRPG